MLLVLLPPKAKKTTLTIPVNGYREEGFLNYLAEMPSVTKIIITGDGYNYPYGFFPNLTTFELSKGNKKAKVVDGVLYSSNQKTLIWYPQNKKGNSFTVPSSVTSFRDDTFYIQNYLETIILSMNLKNRSDSTWFINCKKLKQIKIATNNPYMTAIDGVLYNKKRTTVICYPSAKTSSTYTIPDTVEYFNASGKNNFLKSLTIGKNLRDFSNGQNNIYLEGFTKLEYITVKNNKNYVSRDGILYESGWNGLRLKIYPQAKKDKSYVIKKEEESYWGLRDILKSNQYLEKITSINPDIKVIQGNIIYSHEIY